MADVTDPTGLWRDRAAMDEEAEIISHNLVQFLRSVVGEGQEADVAINRELRQVRVYVGGEIVLACTFDDLLGSPGASLN